MLKSEYWFLTFSSPENFKPSSFTSLRSCQHAELLSFINSTFPNPASSLFWGSKNTTNVWISWVTVVILQKHVVWRAAVVSLRIDSPVVCTDWWTDVWKWIWEFFYFKDLKMHHVTVSQSNYTSLTTQEVQNLCLFSWILSVIETEDSLKGWAAKRHGVAWLSIQFEMFQLEYNVCLLLLTEGERCVGAVRQTTEQLLPSGCDTENSFNFIQQEGFVFIRLRFFLSLNEGDVTPEIFRWMQELITFNFTNHKTTF